MVLHMKKTLLALAGPILVLSCAPVVEPKVPSSPGGLVGPKVVPVKAADINWTAGTLRGEPDLYVTVFNQTRKLGNAANEQGQVEQNFVSAGQGGVPANAISGFGINGPDGEDEVYYAQQHGPSVVIYHRMWNPYYDDGPTGWQTARVVTTFNP